jgi:hypothetical protein
MGKEYPTLILQIDLSVNSPYFCFQEEMIAYKTNTSSCGTSFGEKTDRFGNEKTPACALPIWSLSGMMSTSDAEASVKN